MSAHPDGCDKCGKVAELYHNEASGLSYCEACDIASYVEAEQAAKTTMHSFTDVEGGYPLWLQLIHATNDIRPGTFLEPSSTLEVIDVCYVEDYPGAQVIFPAEADRFRGDAKVRIVGKTLEVREALAEAAKTL